MRFPVLLLPEYARFADSDCRLVARLPRCFEYNKNFLENSKKIFIFFVPL